MKEKSHKNGFPPSQKTKLYWGTLLFSFVFVALIFFIPSIQIQEWRLFDFWMKNSHPYTISENVAVVGIDEDLFAPQPDGLGFEWPLEKDTYAEFILMLQKYGAKVVTFDIQFINNVDKYEGGDLLFCELLKTDSLPDADGVNKKLADVVISYGFVIKESSGGEGRIQKSERDKLAPFSVGDGTIRFDNHSVRKVQLPYNNILNSMQQGGFVNKGLTMPDGVSRKMLLLLSANSRLYPSLALSSASTFLGEKITYNEDDKQISLGGNEFSLDEVNSMVLDFRDSIPFYNLSELYKNYHKLESGTLDSLPQLLKNRIVFVGSSAESIGDMGIIPLSSKYGSGQTPNVMTHAYAANTLLKGAGYKIIGGRDGYWIATALTFGLLFVLFLVFNFSSNRYFFFILPAIVLVGTYIMGYALFTNAVFIPILQPIITCALFTVLSVIINYIEDTREHRYIQKMFKTYVSPKYIDMMVESHKIPKLGGEAAWGTAYFTDIEKFSTFSELFEPEELISVLNTYFSKMTNLLQDNNGTLDHYSGDAIIAFFGSPLFFEDHAILACKTACEMQEALDELREIWSQDEKLASKVGNLRTRIGINSGSFVTGNIGCDIRMNWTMIGDSVNLAARLESAAKQYGIYTLIGEETYNGAKEHFIFREVDQIVVVGKKEPTRIYELFEHKSDDVSPFASLIESYEAALAVYYEGDFKMAISLFEQSATLEIEKKVNPSLVMIERCQELLNSPPANWLGIYNMMEK